MSAQTAPGSKSPLAAPLRGVDAFFARFDGPIAANPTRAMLVSTLLGLPLLLAAGFFQETFERGVAAGRQLSWWESQGMPLGFICISIAATLPAYVFARSFVRAKLAAIVACGVGGPLTLPFFLGRWVHDGKPGLTVAAIAAVLALSLVFLARDAARRRRLAVAVLAVAVVAVVFAAGATGLLSLRLPLGAVAWVALPTIALRALK